MILIAIASADDRIECEVIHNFNEKHLVNVQYIAFLGFIFLGSIYLFTCRLF